MFYLKSVRCDEKEVAVVQAALVDRRRDACARPCYCTLSERQMVLQGVHLRVARIRDPVWPSNRPIGEGSSGRGKWKPLGFGLEVAAVRCACVSHPSRDRTMTSYSFCHTERVRSSILIRWWCPEIRQRRTGRPVPQFINTECCRSGKRILSYLPDWRPPSSFERRWQPAFGKTYFAPSLDRACAT